MNPRLILIMCVLAFIGLLLIVGARTFSRWVKIHYPRQASAVLLGLWLLGITGGWLIVREIRDEPTYQPNDLITLQQPVVVKTIALERDSRAVTCVVDLREPLLTARVPGDADEGAPLALPSDVLARFAAKGLGDLSATGT